MKWLMVDEVSTEWIKQRYGVMSLDRLIVALHEYNTIGATHFYDDWHIGK